MRPRSSPDTLSFARKLRDTPTEPEARLWSRLRRKQVLGVRFRRQVPIGPYVVDFASLTARIIVELDGGQHSDEMAYDARRTAYLEQAGFRVLRFWNQDVVRQIESVMDTIWHAVDAQQRPTPRL